MPLSTDEQQAYGSRTMNGAPAPQLSLADALRALAALPDQGQSLLPQPATPAYQQIRIGLPPIQFTPPPPAPPVIVDRVAFNQQQQRAIRIGPPPIQFNDTSGQTQDFPDQGYGSGLIDFVGNQSFDTTGPIESVTHDYPGMYANRERGNFGAAMPSPYPQSEHLHDFRNDQLNFAALNNGTGNDEYAPNAASVGQKMTPQDQLIVEAQQLEAALKAQQQAETNRARKAQLEQALRTLANQITGGSFDALQKTVNTYSAIANIGGTTSEVGIPITAFGYDPQNPATWADAQQRAVAYAQKFPDAKITFPNENQTIGQGVGDVASGLGNVANRAYGAATKEIPGAQQIADVAGQAGQLIGEHAAGALILPGAEYIPGVRQASQLAGKGLGLAASSLVPTEVWQAALTLIPAAKAKTIPELLSAITIGDVSAIDALRNAGKKLGESPAVEELLGKLASESGASKIPGKAVEPLTQEAIDALKAQRLRITQVLGKGEGNRVVNGGIRDVFTVAERYPMADPKRIALMDALESKIADLPPVNQKFIRNALETLPSKTERAVATSAQRASQAARAADALKNVEGTATDRAIRGFKAMGGKQFQRFTPIGDKFTPQEVSDLYAQIEAAASAGKVGIFDGLNATSAVNLLLTGERLPGVSSEALKPLNLAPHELKLLGRVFGPEFEQAIPKSAAHLSNWEKFFDALNLPRALVTALDFSAAGRQGILLAARNPVEWGKSLKPMLKAMGSEQGLNEVGQNIIKNNKYQDAVIHGLELTDIGGGVGAEEAFVSHIASKLPWIKGSERAYVAFLDNLRMLTYEKYANRLEKYAARRSNWDVARTDLVKEQVAKFLNHATGRGSLSGLEKFTPALNAVFFAPRYFASRPQSIWDMVRPGADKFTRQVAFENLGAFVATGVAMLEVAKLAGADVELNPISSDFGKIKIGPSRQEFWGGYQPLARYIAQIASAHTKNASTGEIKFANPGETATRFFRSKLGPLGAAIYDYGPGKQKDYAGHDLVIPFSDLTANRGLNNDTGMLAWNTFMTKILPLSMQDAIQGYLSAGNGLSPSKEGFLRGALAGGVSALGGGVTSFEPTEAQQKTINTNKASDELQKIGASISTNHTLVPAVLESDFNGQAWRTEFAKDNPELGDLSQYKSIEELRAAYVDHWYATKGNIPGEGETETRADYAAAFNKQPATKLWDKNVTLERANFIKAHPSEVKKLRADGQITLTKDEEKLLP